MKKILGTLVIASIGGFISLAANNLFSAKSNYVENKSNSKVPLQLAASTYSNLSPTIGPDFTRAAELTIHAVVHIKTEYQQKNAYYDDFFNFNDPFYQFFWGIPQQRMNKPKPIQAAGSGVIISDNGYIVTNNHVVEGADNIEVILNDKRSYQAKLVGSDPATDLALIKIEETMLPFITYGNSDSVKIGQWVLAVGNPFNLTSTVTAGIVSAKARKLNILGSESAVESFIQTDAAVNPGNSGGALVNEKGELVGINAAIATNTGAYAGYSFAIPVNIVKKVVQDLLEFQVVQRAYLGVQITELDSKTAKENDIDLIKGVFVAGLVEDGSAKEAGLKKGDVITKIDDVPVASPSELQEKISYHRPGDKVTVEINRNGKNLFVDVVLKNRNNETGIIKTDEQNVLRLLGATFEPASKKELSNLRLDYGVKVKELKQGKLASSGIREGFIITTIDKKPIKTIDDIAKALTNKTGGVLIEGYYPNGMRAYYGFGL